MKSINATLVALSLFLPLSFAFAEEAKKAEEKKTEEKKAELIQKLICHGPHEKRTLEINANGKGCILLYNKQNESKEVARAMNNMEPCKTAMEKIRTRLESGNFACE